MYRYLIGAVAFTLALPLSASAQGDSNFDQRPPIVVPSDDVHDLPIVFLTDLGTDKVYRAIDWTNSGGYNQRAFGCSTNSKRELHVFYDPTALHDFTSIPLVQPFALSASPNDYIYVTDLVGKIVVALEDLDDDCFTHSTVGGIDETLIYFDGTPGAVYGGNDSGLTLDLPYGVFTRHLGEILVANASAVPGTDYILYLEDMNGDLDANDDSESVVYYVTDPDAATVRASIPSAVAQGDDEHVYYLENGDGTGPAKGVWRLVDVDRDGMVDPTGVDVVEPFFLPTAADLIAEGVVSPVAMDLVALDLTVEEEPDHEGGKMTHHEFWFVMDRANAVVWLMEDEDRDGTIAYSDGEASVWWHIQSPSMSFDLAVGGEEMGGGEEPVLAALFSQDRNPDRIHYANDENEDAVIDEGTEVSFNTFNENAPGTENLDRPRGIDADFHGHEEVGEPFCSGTKRLCPCGVGAGVEEGCPNSTGDGAHLQGEGTSGVALDDLEFHASGLLGDVAYLYVGDLDPDAFPLGDGIMCIGGTTSLVGGSPVVDGEATWGPGLIAAGADWMAGDTRFFQVLYRDDDDWCTGSTTNTTNAIAVKFTQ
jgi:hypothetical protein